MIFSLPEHHNPMSERRETRETLGSGGRRDYSAKSANPSPSSRISPTGSVIKVSRSKVNLNGLASPGIYFNNEDAVDVCL